MNLLQHALSRRRFELPPDVDAFAGLVAQTSRGAVDGKYETAGSSLDEMAERVYKASGPVFALIAVRQLLLSEARFQWRQLRNGRPGDLFGTAALELLEHPWPGATTGDLLSRMELHDSLMGNAYVAQREPNRLRVLRPDWVTTVWGSHLDPDLAGDAVDAELLGYVYLPRQPGAFANLDTTGTVFLPDQVAHYAPRPDPQMLSRGMSWVTPVLREIAADSDALVHKQSFFRNGASPRLAMKVDPSVSKESFEKLVAAMEQQHTGPWNAYKTLYVGGGADPVPLTFNLKDIDFKAVTGGGETRLAAAAGIHPSIVGFSEGMEGSSLNAGNYAATRRRVGDGTLRPLWRNMAGSFETLFPPPSGSQLWYDDRDIAFLREDRGDAATITANQATTIRTLVDAGFDPDAAVAAAQSGDLASLAGNHTGLFSVQLQPPANGEMNQPAPKPDDEGQDAP